MRGLLIASLLCVGIAGVRAAETIDRVLALVAGQLITLTDVTAARDLGLVSADAAADPVRAVLSKLIDRELILAEADRYAPPEPDAEAIDREIERVRARFQSPQAFDLALARSGIDEKHLREMLRQDLRIRAYEDQRFTVQPPSDADVTQYYRQHIAAFTRNGVEQPLDTVRGDVSRLVAQTRRDGAIADWVAGLRRRGDILDLYLPSR